MKSIVSAGVGPSGPPLSSRVGRSGRIRLSRRALGPLRSERGSVTAETAIAIPCLAVVGMLLMWAIGIGSSALALADAAGQAARAAARGESTAVVAFLASRAAPRADVAVRQQGGLVNVDLAQRVSIPLPLLEGFAVTVRRSATAAQEVP